MSAVLAVMSDANATVLGVCLMLYGTFAFGFTLGRYPDRQGEGIFEGLPAWVALGMIALILGVIIALAVNTSGCAPGECDGLERPGP